MRKHALVLLIFLLTMMVVSSSALAQVTTTGKISGRVVDKANGEPLIGANVTVEQTKLGGVTDVNGEFFIINIPVGTYTVKASLLGYQAVLIEKVRVSAGFTTELKFEMPAEALELKPVIIQATRPLIQKDQTNTTVIKTAEEIKNLPLRGYEGVVSVGTGVVAGRGTDNNTFYTRGGRAKETILYVDGFEQNNLLTGEATVSVNTNAIEEIQTQTGGFNAEYGRALSGVINIVTKEAAPRYNAQIEAESDFFMGNKNSHGYNVYNLSLSGPVIPDYDALTLFVSGELKNLATSRASHGTVGMIYYGGKLQNWDKGYLPKDRNDGLTLQGRLSYRITPTLKFHVNYLSSNFNKQTYFDIWKYNLDHAPVQNDKNRTISGTLTYTLSNSTFIEASAAFFQTEHFTGDGVYQDRFRLYANAGQDNPRNLYDPARGGYLFPAGWERWQGNVADTTGMNAFIDTNGYRPYFIAANRYDPYGFYFAPGYASRFLRKYKSSYINPKVNIVSQVDEHNQIKAGFEYRRHTVRYYENFETNRGVNATILNAYGYTHQGVENDNGAGGLLDGVRHPFEIAAYVQDKFEQEGLVVNAGIRFDFFNANTKALKDEQDPLGANQVPSGDPRARKADPTDFADTKTESQISPRLGIGFPVTDKTVFHFNFGKFFQQPNLTDLYYGTKLIEFKAISGSPTYNTQNPNLKPEETTSYEVGINHQVADNVRFSVSAYYKDTKNLVNVRYTPTTAPGGAALYLISNQDYGTIKGIDMDIEARRIGRVSGRLAYSLAFAEGTGSQSRENFNAVWLGYETAKFTQPLAFDQRHTISANIDIRNMKGEGVGVLENAGMNLLLLARSGFPYTPTEKYNAPASTISISVPKDNPIDGVNTRYGAWTFRVDLKVDKEVDWGMFRTDFYVRVLNLLDTKNYLGVYQATGDGDADGYLGTTKGKNDMQLYDTDNHIYTTGADFANRYQERLNGVDLNVNGNSQRRFDTPREVRLGVIVNF